MKLRWISLISALISAPVLHAQTLYSAPKENLDSVHLRLRGVLEGLRDSLTLVDAAAARIQRDLERSSDAVVLGRGRELRDGCRLGVAMATTTLQRVNAIGLPSPDARKQLPRFRLALDSLAANLTKCQREFDTLSTPSKVADLRGYAISRGIRAQSAIRQYEAGLQAYLASVGFGLSQIRPGGKLAHQ